MNAKFRRIIGNALANGRLLAVFLAVSTPIGTAAASPRVTSHEVIRAIKRGVSYLLAQRQGKQYWETGIRAGIFNDPAQESGVYGAETALVTESLLTVQGTLALPELNIFKQPMRGAIKFLSTIRGHTTYQAAFQAGVFTLLPKRPAYRIVLKADEQFLLHSLHRNGAYSYAWYPHGPQKFPDTSANWDNSNSQYGVLGMWACAHDGLAVPALYWRLTERHWRVSQHADGTWGYFGFAGRPTAPSAGRAATFTPAGLASLFIDDEFLNARRVGSRAKPNPTIVSALHWMSRNFNARETDEYAMYANERAGLASGLKYFGTHDWYRDYAYTLVHNQNADGSWPGDFWGSSPVIDTAYALLILDRGLNPVFMNKLQYTRHFYGSWNDRQRDVANVTSWISNNTESDLNWQVVNINSPVSGWLDSPILYISGNRPPAFSPSEIQKLRDYVNAGGMVFCNCNGSSEGFRNAMLKLGQEVVKKRYEFHTLQSNSPLFQMQPWFHFYFLVQGLSNGVRELWLVSTMDLGRVWQARFYSQKRCWEFPLNLYLYATDKGYLGNRLQSLWIEKAKRSVKRTLLMGELRYAGNWNPEPGAWPRMALLAQRDFHTQLRVQSVASGKLHAATMGLLHLTGTGEVSFSKHQVAALHTYIAAGGMLFADAAGGKPAFTDSIIRLVAALYPGTALQPLPTNCSIYTGKIPGGRSALKVQYRRQGTAGIKKTKPSLLGIKKAGRWVLIYSADDITSGLLGTNTWGIKGYAPKSAQALARNIIVYAAAHHK